jgi:hypothetical protein
MTSTKFLRITLGLPRPTANSLIRLFVLTYNMIAAVQDRAGCRDKHRIHFSTKVLQQACRTLVSQGRIRPRPNDLKKYITQTVEI